jgi:engulfment/cell motility protein 1
MKDKFWFCRLCPSQKYLHYGDCEENRIPSLDELTNKIAVKDIRQVVVGRDCPHMKDSKSKKSTYPTAFSLIPFCDQDDSLNFVAPTDKVFDYWLDGINALLQLEMSSREYKNDLEVLVSMDIKLRLLETEGVTIPEKAPKLPPPPPNFDFSVNTPMSEMMFFTHRA